MLAIPPTQSHAGSWAAARTPAKPRSQSIRAAAAQRKETSTENATAGTIPTRSPNSPITAAWTPPAIPAVKQIETARAVPLDTGRSYTLRPVAADGKESHGSRVRPVRGEAGSGAVRAACGAVPQGPRRDVQTRPRVRRPDGRAEVPVLRRVGVCRHGRLQVHRHGRDGDGRALPRPLRRGRVTEPSYPRPHAPDELGFEKIVYEKTPPRATITFNRPDVLNAFDFQMLRELARACEDASWDDEIRVVVLTGKGRAFCVGADLRNWAEEYVGKPTEYWKWFGAFKDAHDRLREIGKPTLARINGIAVGGGNELQMACDLAVMVDDAFIRHVGPEHGSVPAGGATQWLAIMVGDRRAREIVFMCEEIPARLAEEWGLVNWAVPGAELDAKTDEVVENLARKLPQTTRYAKQHMNFWRDLAWHETINHARDWLALSMATDEPKAAIEKFLKK